MLEVSALSPTVLSKSGPWAPDGSPRPFLESRRSKLLSYKSEDIVCIFTDICAGYKTMMDKAAVA